MTQNRTIPFLMTDIEGCALCDEDRWLFADERVAGLILFARNVQSPAQVRRLTDALRAHRSDLVVAVDQEGGRVARFRDGFTPLPAMGELGAFYDALQPDNKAQALATATDMGYTMACETLAVGVDFSFAPVLDIDNKSLVIGDRAFHRDPKVAALLASAFIDGMNKAGMQATGKHFPGHGSVEPDSHVAHAVDARPLQAIWQSDLQTFIGVMEKLGALMPAHVVFSSVDDKPAGFSSVWLQQIVRRRLGFDGVLFSDDLSMKAAHVAGDTAARVRAALEAGCDVALVCNDRSGAKATLQADWSSFAPSVFRLGKMKAAIPPWQGDLTATCVAAFDGYTGACDRVRGFGG